MIILSWNCVGYPFCLSDDFNFTISLWSLWQLETIGKLLYNSVVIKLTFILSCNKGSIVGITSRKC